MSGGYRIKCMSCQAERDSLHCCEYMMCPSCKTVTRVAWGWNVGYDAQPVGTAKPESEKEVSCEREPPHKHAEKEE